MVGSKLIRDVDDGWPKVGTRFHHEVGLGPLTIDDHSQVVAAERPRLFCLRVKGRPAGTAIVTLEMEPGPPPAAPWCGCQRIPTGSSAG